MTTSATPAPRPPSVAATTRRGLSRPAGRWGALAVLVVTAVGLAVGVPAHPGSAETTGPRAAAESPTVARSAVATHSAGTGTHTVGRGDTLSGVARTYGTSVSALVATNDLSDPDLIHPGMVLTVPGRAAAPGATGGAVSPPSATAGLPGRLQGSPDRLALRPTFARWAEANGIPLDLLEAMTWLESGWQGGLVSPDGAVGIGQLMPATVDHMELLIGVDLDPFVAEDNIRMSARYLRWLLARTGSAEQALAGYYQGLASVQRDGWYGETEVYVANVLALRARF